MLGGSRFPPFLWTTEPFVPSCFCHLSGVPGILECLWLIVGFCKNSAVAHFTPRKSVYWVRLAFQYEQTTRSNFDIDKQNICCPWPFIPEYHWIRFASLATNTDVCNSVVGWLIISETSTCWVDGISHPITQQWLLSRCIMLDLLYIQNIIVHIPLNSRYQISIHIIQLLYFPLLNGRSQQCYFHIMWYELINGILTILLPHITLIHVIPIFLMNILPW